MSAFIRPTTTLRNRTITRRELPMSSRSNVAAPDIVLSTRIVSGARR